MRMSNEYGRRLKRKIDKKLLEKSIKVCKSMTESSKYLNLSYTTFKKYCKKYDLWNDENINQGGKGISKKRNV